MAPGRFLLPPLKIFLPTPLVAPSFHVVSVDKNRKY